MCEGVGRKNPQITYSSAVFIFALDVVRQLSNILGSVDNLRMHKVINLLNIK